MSSTSAEPVESVFPRWFGAFGSDFYYDFITNRNCILGGKFFLFTPGKLSLCSPFGFLALLFESLHFFLAFLVRSGHQASFQICADQVIS